MTAKRLKQSLYPSEPTAEKYLCYVFDEEVTLGDLDIDALITSVRIAKREEFVEGAPVFVKGEELIRYRK